MLIRNYYKNVTATGWNFSSTEWDSIIVSGSTAAAISFAANSCVLIVHTFMTWYRPVIVNRLSLRMIVISCICNMIYCACQLVTDDISSQSFSCRAFAYVLIASDTMACMCLAMVGLNLVMIFVLKVAKTIKLEILYYLIIALSGILVCIVPVLVGTAKGPKNKRDESSCWYHYYFDGRMNNIFNWMWYYGFLLFSLVFAATCAAISIRFVVKKQENFSGALDMFTRRERKDLTAMAIIRKYTNNNTDVFQKIARRCVCYPLVPLISKSWGVGIEIAASQDAHIPVAIFVLDRIFSCLLGFMVSCIYFTDPAIGAVFRESIESVKQKYVYNYYSVQFLPSNDTTIDLNAQYPILLKITPTSEHYDHTAEFVKEARNRYFGQSPGEAEESVRDLRSNTQSPVSMTRSGLRSLDETDGSAPFQLNTASPIFKKELPTMRLNKIHGRPVNSVSPPPEKQYSIISVTSKNGNAFLPNESAIDLKELPKYVDELEHQKLTTAICLSGRKKIVTIPMRRVHESSVLEKKANLKNTFKNPQLRGSVSFPKHNTTVEILVPFKWPVSAKVIHWILIKIFRVKTIDIRESDEDNLSECQYGIQMKQGEPSRVFRDFTDGSDPGTPCMPARNYSISFHPDVELRNTGASSRTTAPYMQKCPSSMSLDDASCDEDIGSKHSAITANKRQRLTSASSMCSIKRPNSSFIGERMPIHPLRRVSSINVASLQRERARKLSISAPFFHKQDTEGSIDRSLPTIKFVSSMGLSKMLNRGRSMSFSWNRLTNVKGKAGPSPETSTHALGQTVPMAVEAKNDNEATEMGELPSAPAETSSSKMIGEPIDKDIYNVDLDNLVTDDNKPSSSHSKSPVSPETATTTLSPPSPAMISTPVSSQIDYPISLSPRPRSQYKKPALIGKQQHSRQITTVATDVPHLLSRTVKRISKRKKRASLLSIEDNTHLSEFFHGSTSGSQSPTTQSKSPTHSSSYFSEEPEELMLTIRGQPTTIDTEQTGLSHGHTTINFISNWEDAENVESNRIIGISEPWDLDEQLRKQYEFAEQVQRL